MLNPIYKWNVQGENIQEIAHLQNQNYLVTETCCSKWKIMATKNNNHNNEDEI